MSFVLGVILAFASVWHAPVSGYLDPGKLIASYFTAEAFNKANATNGMSVREDQSGNNHNIDVAPSNMIIEEDYVTFNHNGGVAVNSLRNYEWGEELGVIFWFRRAPPGSDAAQGLIGNTDNDNRGSFGCYLTGVDEYNKDNTFGVYIDVIDYENGKRVPETFDGLNINVDEWHMAVFTKNADILNFYIDSRKVTFNGEFDWPAHGEVYPNENPLHIGGKKHQNEPFIGDMRDIYIYKQFIGRDDVCLLYGCETLYPTPVPTPYPPKQPTPEPTAAVTPTAVPTYSPSEAPTERPSEGPTLTPTHHSGTAHPTSTPTKAPYVPTLKPSAIPTRPPTLTPTTSVNPQPSHSAAPTMAPTGGFQKPTLQPTHSPTSTQTKPAPAPVPGPPVGSVEPTFGPTSTPTGAADNSDGGDGSGGGKESKSSSSGISVGEEVGIVLGGIFFLAVIFAIVFVYRNKMWKERFGLATQGDGDKGAGSSSTSSSDAPAEVEPQKAAGIKSRKKDDAEDSDEEPDSTPDEAYERWMKVVESNRDIGGVQGRPEGLADTANPLHDLESGSGGGATTTDDLIIGDVDKSRLSSTEGPSSIYDGYVVNDQVRRLSQELGRSESAIEDVVREKRMSSTSGSPEGGARRFSTRDPNAPEMEVKDRETALLRQAMAIQGVSAPAGGGRRPSVLSTPNKMGGAAGRGARRGSLLDRSPAGGAPRRLTAKYTPPLAAVRGSAVADEAPIPIPQSRVSRSSPPDSTTSSQVKDGDL